MFHLKILEKIGYIPTCSKICFDPLALGYYFLASDIWMILNVTEVF